MKINIRYFGKLTDITGTEREEIEIHNQPTVADIEQRLFVKYIQLQKENYALFKNNSILKEKTSVLNEQDEISLMPPFSGG